MTTTRDEWIRSRQRKRQAISWSAALGIYLVVMLVLMLFSALSIKEISDYSGPVIVRLGSPTGAEVAKPVAEPQSATTAAQAPQPVVQPTPQAAAAAAPTPVPKPAEKPTLSSKPTQPAAPTAQQPTTPIAIPQPAPPTVVLKGSESGNSYDMTINSGSGIVGRSLYVPIWLYLPVPFELPASLYVAIPDLAGLPGTADKRRAVFETHYEQKSDGTWQLKRLRQPEFDARPELWTMLEDAGYDVKTADYKNGKHLRAIGILFKVSAPGPSGKPTLEDVHLEESSGYGDIDQAVLYGFRKAEFSNSGTSSISGRFTYRF
ncbi:MAG TPA: hypothetical protein VMX33_03595 [bacterium]|nr:hypothetical protein [bacterium]